MYVKASIPDDLAIEEEKYITKIRGLRHEMEQLYKNNAMDLYKQKEEELKNIKLEFNKFINELRKKYPEYVSINYPKPVGIARTELNKNEVLAMFEVTEAKTYLFLVDGETKGLKVKEINITRKDLQNKVLKYRNYFESIERYDDLSKYDPRLAKELYDTLFGDILNNISNGKDIIIVPDEFLGIFPFESLVTKLPEREKLSKGEYGPFYLGVEYLGDKHEISYAQSASSLTILRSLKKEKTSGRMALAVCDPVFSWKDSRVSGKEMANADKTQSMLAEIEEAMKSRVEHLGVEGVRGRGSEVSKELGDKEIFRRVEKTQKIAESVGKLFRSTILTGLDAKEEEVVKLPLTEYRYIVFGTHGILDKTIPYIQQPALVLSQVGNSEGYDGFLTMGEVMGLKIPAKVVALTACQTGVGENVSGEGVMGMGRAFQYAGASNVLMSLWSVAEDATVALSNSFFKNLKEGKDPKQALRFARAEIRRNGYEHPFYWSAFILMGE